MKKSISITIEETLISTLDKAAFDANRSRSNMIELLITEYLKKEGVQDAKIQE